MLIGCDWLRLHRCSGKILTRMKEWRAKDEERERRRTSVEREEEDGGLELKVQSVKYVQLKKMS